MEDLVDPLIQTDGNKKTRRISAEWHALVLNSDLALNEIAKKKGKLYQWAGRCFCQECKSIKKMSEKRAKELQDLQWKEAVIRMKQEKDLCNIGKK